MKWTAVLCLLPMSSLCGQEMKLDLNRDGKIERIVNHPGRSEILDAEGGLAAFQLPDGLTFLDAQGGDTGLRLLDLNQDGFPDLILSNAERVEIRLWNKKVMPHLGWTPGWSRPVRKARRSGAAGEPPVLTGAEVKVEDNQLVVTRARKVSQVPTRELIAFEMPPLPTPQQALQSFVVRPGFKVELAACEPDVVSPVAFDWDARGRLFVVEMRDYPLGMDNKGQPGGVVKMLTDPNNDGRWDQSVVFAEGLRFPTGLFPWRDGLLVAAAPDILFLRDTNGDGKADDRRVLFTGFTEGNQQHRFNGFEWGLDGWLYGANGDSGGEVRCVATASGAPPVKQEPVNIRGRDFRFQPDTGEFETVSGMSQYGLRRDDYGRWFANNNPVWLWHVTMPEHYLRRNPKLAVASVKQMLAEDNRVFPASAPVTRLNQPETYGHVTSGCSPAPYRDNLFGPEFANSVFICEPMHNAVHREVVREEGFGLASSRAGDEKDREFLASTDHWFRPVFCKTGPDGALWIADMVRFILEHPEWIAPEDMERMDLRAGSNRGRIWRVVPDNVHERPMPNFTGLGDADITARIQSPNGWGRDTAHRLIIEHAIAAPALDPTFAPVEILSRMAVDQSQQPATRCHALAVLHTLDELHREPSDPEILSSALSDPHPQVRCQALRNAELHTSAEPSLLSDICALAQDESPAVRQQLAFTLGEWPRLTAFATLSQMASRDGADPLMRAAILSSVRPDSPLMEQLRGTDPKASNFTLPKLDTAPNPDRVALIARYVKELPALKGDAARGKDKFTGNCAVCHRMKELGTAIGPDLAMTLTKPDDWLLTALLDPNAAVEARYSVWVATLKDGTVTAGILTSETANNLTLRSADGREHTILRSDLKEITPLHRSLMPEGLEAALHPQDVADLLAWLREK
jgi:putative membrane-bound dehydrogenase-like protein